MPRGSYRVSRGSAQRRADGFRNYVNTKKLQFMAPVEALVDRAALMRLGPGDDGSSAAPRVLGANAGNSKHGVFTKQPEKLTNDFFLNLLDMSTEWTPVGDDVYEGRDRKTKELKWTGTPVDLIFGSHSQVAWMYLVVPTIEGTNGLVARGQGDEVERSTSDYRCVKQTKPRLAHDPAKWEPVRRQDHAPLITLARDRTQNRFPLLLIAARPGLLFHLQLDQKQRLTQRTLYPHGVATHFFT